MAHANFVEKLLTESKRKRSMKPVIMKLAQEDIDALDQICTTHGITRQAALENAVKDCLCDAQNTTEARKKRVEEMAA